MSLCVTSDLQAGLLANMPEACIGVMFCMLSNTQQPFRVHGLLGLQLHLAETTKSRASRTRDSSTEDVALCVRSQYT